MTQTTEAPFEPWSDQMQHAIERCASLLMGLTGERRHDCAPVHFIALAVIYQLSDVEAQAIDAVVARLQAAFAAYIYTVPDVAARLGISCLAVHRLIRRGELSCELLHGQRVFTERQVARYLARSGSPPALATAAD